MTILTNIDSLSKTILDNDNYIIVSHINPDGDSIGSTAAMGLLLSSLNKNYLILLEDELPDKYSFLYSSLNWTAEIKDNHSYDYLIALDCSDEERLEPYSDFLKSLKVINVDHHATNTQFGHINLVDSKAAATGQIVFELAEQLLANDISKEIGQAVYVAITTDTGSFRYDNVSAKTHRIAAKLLELDINHARLARNVMDEKPLSAVLLMQKALGTLKLEANGKIAYIVVTDEMVIDCNGNDDDTDGFVNLAINIDSVEVGLLFRLKKDEKIKVSFRSKTVDISSVALSFGGGGHPRAAGCQIEGELGQAIEKVTSTLIKELGL